MYEGEFLVEFFVYLFLVCLSIFHPNTQLKYTPNTIHKYFYLYTLTEKKNFYF